MKKRVVIYESSSKGGNYNYSLHLQKGFQALEEVESCTLLLPVNAEAEGKDIVKILSDDSVMVNKWKARFGFVKRSFTNPRRLSKWLWKQPNSFVLLNDFEQLSAPFWVKKLNKLRPRHRLAIFMHDPDRDNYLGIRPMARWTMKHLLKPFHAVIHHGPLPDRWYYRQFTGQIQSIDHPIFPASGLDHGFFKELEQIRGLGPLLCIPGNIRLEKNYSLCLQALQQLPEAKLLIAGSASSSQVDVPALQREAEDLGLGDRVQFIVRYLSDGELAAIFSVSDLVLLYYAPSFTSQSGILNLLAPFSTKILVSDVSSAMRDVVRDFNLGVVAKPQNAKALAAAIPEALAFQPDWQSYVQGRTWDHAAEAILKSIE